MPVQFRNLTPVFQSHVPSGKVSRTEGWGLREKAARMENATCTLSMLRSLVWIGRPLWVGFNCACEQSELVSAFQVEDLPAQIWTTTPDLKFDAAAERLPTVGSEREIERDSKLVPAGQPLDLAGLLLSKADAKQTTSYRHCINHVRQMRPVFPARRPQYGREGFEPTVGQSWQASGNQHRSTAEEFGGFGESAFRWRLKEVERRREDAFGQTRLPSVRLHQRIDVFW
jgi:hypothetical protein